MKVNFLELKREWDYFREDFINTFDKFGNDAYYVLGPAVKEFEDAFAKYCGYKHAIGVSSGLAALECALLAHGVKSGDEVITVPNSAVATALAISNIGAKPVFCDIGDDFLMDANKLEALINSKTKAILPVHLFGKICDMEAINRVATKHKLIVIEDACQAHGADFVSEKGSLINTKAYSFYPTKNLGGLGEGGMVVTNDDEVLAFIEKYRNYGQDGRYNHVIKGNNYRIDGLQCVLLGEKLKKLNDFTEKRRGIAQEYCQSLEEVEGLVVNSYDSSCSYHLFVVRVLNNKRDELKKLLNNIGVQTMIHYPTAIHKQICYKKEYDNIEMEVTDKFQEEILSLPCHPFLEEKELEHIIHSIKEFYAS